MPEFIQTVKSKRGGARPGAGRPRKNAPQAKSFESAQPSYDRKLVYLTSLEAKKELPSWDRMRLLQSGRHAVNNNPVASRIVRGISRYAVGNGLVPKAKTSDTEWNKLAQRLFEDRVATDAFAFDKSAAVNFYEAQRLIVQQIICDGEFFAQLTSSQSGSAMCRFFGAEYVGNQSAKDEKEGWIDGMQVNEDGKPIKYRVLQDPTSQKSPFVDIDTTDIIHMRRLHRAGFLRGVSWLAASINRLQDLGEMLESEQLAAKLNSKIGLVIESADAGSIGLGSSLRKQQGGTSEEITFDRLTSGVGNVQLKPGEKLVAHDFNRPNANFADWTKFIIREIAWSCDCSPEILWDLSESGGAVTRHILQDAEIFFAEIRQIVEYQFARRFWRFWVWSMIRTGQLPNPGLDWWRCDWIAPQKLTVDVGRDGKLRKDLVQAGLLSPQRYFDEISQDEEEETDDIIRAAARKKRRVAEIAEEEGVDLEFYEVFPPAPGSQPVVMQDTEDDAKPEPKKQEPEDE